MPVKKFKIKGHPEVDRFFDKKIKEWEKRYADRVKIRPENHIYFKTVDTPSVTKSETASEFIDRIKEALKPHSRIITASDVRNTMEFIKKIEEIRDWGEGANVKPVIWIEDKEKEVPADIDELLSKFFRWEPLSDSERKKLIDYLNSEVIWPFISYEKGGRQYVELVPGERIPKDVVPKEKAAEWLLDFSENKDAFYSVLDRLLGVKEVGRDDQDSLYDAYSHALRAITLYRFRGALSDEHYKQILGIIQKRIGKSGLEITIRELEKQKADAGPEFARLVRKAVRHINSK